MKHNSKSYSLKKKLIFSLLTFLFISFNSLYSQESKAYRLTTDLIEHTDKVWSNGHITNVNIKELKSFDSSFQYAFIRSTNPKFSWNVPGNTTGEVQTAYQILLSDNLKDITSCRGNIWDSGKVKSHNSVSVELNAKTLNPNTTYFWRVKSFTNHHPNAQWSDIKAFRTADKLTPNEISYYPTEKTTSHPVEMKNLGNGNYFFDFGKDVFSQLNITLNSELDNDTVYVHLGEALKDGKIMRNVGSLTVRYHCYKLALSKGEHTYHINIRKDKRNTGVAAIKMPSYIGEVLPFRYCEIEGYDNKLTVNDISREYAHYPFDNGAAYFESSNQTLNKVWNLCKYSIYATSFAGIFVDGDRERIPYEADILINQLGHYSIDREYSLSRRSCEHILQHPTWPTEWILQAVAIAWNDYMYTADKSLLAKSYEILKSRVLMDLREKNGFISTTTGLQSDQFKKSINFNKDIRDIVDWPNSKAGKIGTDQGESDGFVFTDYNSVVNVWHCAALKYFAEIAKVLDKKSDMEYYNKEYESFKKKYLDSFFDKKTQLFTDGIANEENHSSLHSNIFPIALDIFPKRCDKVSSFIENKGMACSVYGSQFLLDALYNLGDSKAALSLLTEEGVRGWYNMLKAGSTITMEAWDNRYKPNQDWNHAWGAAPANIIPRRLVGVTPLKPGFESVLIKPQTADLKWVKAVVPTIRGSIGVDVTNDSNKYTLKVIIPANMEAQIYIPKLDGNKKITCNGKAIKTIVSKDGKSVYVGSFLSGTYLIER